MNTYKVEVTFEGSREAGEYLMVSAVDAGAARARAMTMLAPGFDADTASIVEGEEPTAVVAEEAPPTAEEPPADEIPPAVEEPPASGGPEPEPAELDHPDHDPTV
jgi:hypothetical protein